MLCLTFIDTQSAGDKIDSVPEEEPKRATSRYGTIIATLVGFLALCVSAYTAYMQRQQVRAAVWPILEFQTSNAPEINFTLANKGVGPAIIKNVIVRVDDQPMKNWGDVLEKLIGPGKHPASESDMHNHILSAGESMTILAPRSADDGSLVSFDRSNSLWVQLDKGRERVSVEICYCSTLDECWTLRAGEASRSTTSETGRCPNPSAISFQQ